MGYSFCPEIMHTATTLSFFNFPKEEGRGGKTEGHHGYLEPSAELSISDLGAGLAGYQSMYNKTNEEEAVCDRGLLGKALIYAKFEPLPAIFFFSEHFS